MRAVCGRSAEYALPLLAAAGWQQHPAGRLCRCSAAAGCSLHRQGLQVRLRAVATFGAVAKKSFERCAHGTGLLIIHTVAGAPHANPPLVCVAHAARRPHARRESELDGLGVSHEPSDGLRAANTRRSRERREHRLREPFLARHRPHEWATRESGSPPDLVRACRCELGRVDAGRPVSCTGGRDRRPRWKPVESRFPRERHLGRGPITPRDARNGSESLCVQSVGFGSPLLTIVTC